MDMLTFLAMDYEVATLNKLYLTITGITLVSSLKLKEQYLKINNHSYQLLTDRQAYLNYRKLCFKIIE